MSIDFVILSGGIGSRTLSKTPKFLQEIAGVPCVSHIINTCQKVSKNGEIIVVTKPEFAKHEVFKNLQVAIQKNPIGTGDALKCALPFVTGEEVIVMCSDMPLIEPAYLNSLAESSHTLLSLIGTKIPEKVKNTQYGRIITNNGITRIIEYKNATDKERLCNIVNTGIYKFNTNKLKNNINKIVIDKNSGEYYLTDILNYIKGDINVIILDDYDSFLGINTMEDMAIVENIFQKKLHKKMMARGVKFLDPNSVYLSVDTHIESDVVLEQNIVIKKGVVIMAGSIIKSFSYLEDCVIRNNVNVGPFTRIRGSSILSENSEIGNFVEIKKSEIGSRSKVKHLSYIGDSFLGEKVNIGAGTITCNYDGVNKHKTKINDNTMVGANCSLIAPLQIGENSVIAAGSVITDDVPKNTTAFGRARQVNKNIKN
ncbi:MAG: bifunctional UDP-N-acetylglucosamine diphosphorylase/glucosamine-1-phosphate N-acetyltransferase GlmU [Holosporales bacterium]|jgi:bifunctional UDP-N-acetylglucosamine pyrophosphorylase/glucosamine-1-phosphate N-acetyltransferase|nr:bifunctional UDP-N-acetylglucosamine diphosphorylase/glucosamine-1-phosphate N-acetyltransferase GlmU [Holosporales bacterium]